jgi:hypothetical protein
MKYINFKTLSKFHQIILQKWYTIVPFQVWQKLYYLKCKKFIGFKKLLHDSFKVLVCTLVHVL